MGHTIPGDISLSDDDGRASTAEAGMKGDRPYRHSLVVRVTHWINLVCLAILLMSGLQIFNAHPALYWGNDSDFDAPVASIGVARTPTGRTVGVTTVLGTRLDTTGFLGLSAVQGRPAARAFPAWLTLPSYQDLATGRVWHFFFAWVLALNGSVYLAHSLVTGHIKRDLWLRRDHWKTIGSTLLNHLRLRFHQQAEYNVLQRLSYLVVILVALPFMILAGLAMSPGVNAFAPWLLDIFGGRQSARTVHFLLAQLIVLFVVIHLMMVVLSGVRSNLTAMITGRYKSNASTGEAK